MKQLKKISALFFVLFTLALVTTSCDKDDDKDEVKDSSLVGTWAAEWYDYKDGEYCKEIFTFKSDGTGTCTWIYDGDREVETFRWTATKRTVTLYFGDEEETYFYSISSNGKALTWDWDDEETYYKQ